MCPVPFSLTLNQAQWTRSDQDLLVKSSGQITLFLVCTLLLLLSVSTGYLGFSVQTITVVN